MRTIIVAVLVCLATAVATRADQQTTGTWRGKNLQVFPADVERPVLLQRMREFSFALAVRCQYCHVGEAGAPLDAIDFASDAKPAKRTARAMIRMVAMLNESVLPALDSRQDPPVRMDCVICHRGLPRPKTLATELTDVLNRDGVGKAIAHYRDLRENRALLGLFRYDEWSMNELATGLANEGRTEAAVALLELNADYYPQSTAIDMMLADLYLRQGDREKALARAEAALKKDPNNPVIQQRLKAIRGG
jgi:tetratricopeptide (TPR) repeat protein